MPINLPGVPFKLTARDMGSPDYSQALSRGLQNAQSIMETMNKPKSMQEALLHQQLQNKMQQGQIAMQPLQQQQMQGQLAMQPLQQQRIQGELDLLPYRQRLLEAQAKGSRYQSPEEKTQQAIDIAAGKSDITDRAKTKREILDEARHMRKAARDVGQIENLLQSGTTTGFLPSIGAKTGIGGKDLAGFNEAATRLQADLARAFSQRGGAAAAKMAGAGKPSTWRGTKYNKNMVESMKKRFKDEYDNMKEDYEKLGMGEFPYSKDEFFKQAFESSQSEQFKPRVNFTSQQDFHDYMQSLNPQQRETLISQLKGA